MKSGIIETLHEAFRNGAAVCTDTRNIAPGSLFFALKGERFNGNDYVGQALEAGALYAVADSPATTSGDRVIVVPDALACLQQLATFHRNTFSIPVLAVTGSNGKTTTKELLARVLGAKFKVLYTQGNLNNHIGVPLTLLRLNNSHDFALIEMGANHQREIALLCAIARPTHTLITNVGKAHLEGFGGFEGVKKGKGEMYDYARAHQALVFINRDNPHLASMLGTYAPVFGYGTRNDADVTGRQVTNGSAYVSMEWKSGDGPWHRIDSAIPGDYNFENILSAVAAGVHFGVDAPSICAAVASYRPDNQRSQEVVRGSNRILLDAYNANPTSMEAALRNFSERFSGNRAVFLGDMFELGDSSAAEHAAVVDRVMQMKLDLVVLVGPSFTKAVTGNSIRVFPDSSAAAAWLREHPLHDYHILIKGSRGSKMELVFEAL